MTTYQAGDLVLVAFPDSSGLSAKLRPALVIADTGDNDLILARVTTQQYTTPFDLRLSAWKSAGLLAPSVVRFHKLATLEKKLITRHLGAIREPDRSLAMPVLESIISNW